MKTNKIKNIKETGYKVPENFFDSFADNVIQQINEKKKPVISLRIYKAMTLLAASVLLMFLLYKPSNEIQIESEEIFAWMEYDNSMDIYDITDAYEDQLTQIDFNDKIGQETIEEYLENEITEDYFY